MRNAQRLSVNKETRARIDVIEIDFLDDDASGVIPEDINAAYYLIHSMSGSTSDFDEKEEKSARNFNRFIEPTSCKQVIYLSGIVNDEELSKHLSSRKNVEDILGEGSFALTVLRAAIIVGSGSASFEIIRDLCEKLPVMITPRWVKTRCQPIAIRNVIEFLLGVLGREEVYNDSFDIGGPDILSYKQMMQQYSKVRKLSLFKIDVPFLSPKLSSYWLYFVPPPPINSP